MQHTVQGSFPELTIPSEGTTSLIQDALRDLATAKDGLVPQSALYAPLTSQANPKNDLGITRFNDINKQNAGLLLHNLGVLIRRHGGGKTADEAAKLVWATFAPMLSRATGIKLETVVEAETAAKLAEAAANADDAEKQKNRRLPLIAAFRSALNDVLCYGIDPERRNDTARIFTNKDIADAIELEEKTVQTGLSNTNLTWQSYGLSDVYYRIAACIQQGDFFTKLCGVRSSRLKNSTHIARRDDVRAIDEQKQRTLKAALDTLVTDMQIQDALKTALDALVEEYPESEKPRMSGKASPKPVAPTNANVVQTGSIASGGRISAAPAVVAARRK